LLQEGYRGGKGILTHHDLLGSALDRGGFSLRGLREKGSEAQRGKKPPSIGSGKRKFSTVG